MISQRSATSLQREADDWVLAFEDETQPAEDREARSELPTVKFLSHAVMLLDGSGQLVGIDLGGSGFQRLVIMLGPHEAVASQREIPARLGPSELRFFARDALLPNTPNPYLR